MWGKQVDLGEYTVWITACKSCPFLHKHKLYRRYNVDGVLETLYTYSCEITNMKLENIGVIAIDCPLEERYHK